MIKKLIITCCSMLVLSGAAIGQNFEMNISDPSSKTIEIQLTRANIFISGQKENKLKLMSDFEQGQVPARAAGLSPLRPNMATDNTGYGVDVTEVNSIIYIKEATSQQLNVNLILPENIRLVIKPASWQAGSISVKDFKGEIEAKSNNSDMQLLNVSGPVVASAVNADIEIVFKEINTEKPSAVSNISGFIDVTWPSGAGADFKLTNLSGETYTNFKMEVVEERHFGPDTPDKPAPPSPPTPPAKVGKAEGTAKANMEAAKANIEALMPTLPAFTMGRGTFGKVNGGGVEISLHSISGDIYLRKSK